MQPLNKALVTTGFYLKGKIRKKLLEGWLPDRGGGPYRLISIGQAANRLALL